jgi:hypothetical protein
MDRSCGETHEQSDLSISDATIGISVSNATTISTADASKNPCKGSDILSINFAKSDANQFGSIVAEIKEECNTPKQLQQVWTRYHATRQ